MPGSVHNNINLPSQYGVLNLEPTSLSLMNVLNQGLYDPRSSSIRDYDGPAAAGTRQPFIKEGMMDGKVRPITAKTFALDEIVEAHRYLQSNQ